VRSSEEQNWLQWEDHLLGLLLLNPHLSEHVSGILNDGDFHGSDTRVLYHLILAVAKSDQGARSQPWETLISPALQETLDRVQKCADSFTVTELDCLKLEAKHCALRLRRTRLMQSESELRFLMNEAEDAGDTAMRRQLRQHFLIIRRELLAVNSVMMLQ
jgi:hypothetical protein